MSILSCMCFGVQQAALCLAWGVAVKTSGEAWDFGLRYGICSQTTQWIYQLWPALTLHFCFSSFLPFFTAFRTCISFPHRSYVWNSSFLQELKQGSQSFTSNINRNWQSITNGGVPVRVTLLSHAVSLYHHSAIPVPVGNWRVKQMIFLCGGCLSVGVSIDLHFAQFDVANLKIANGNSKIWKKAQISQKNKKSFYAHLRWIL